VRGAERVSKLKKEVHMTRKTVTVHRLIVAITIFSSLAFSLLSISCSVVREVSAVVYGTNDYFRVESLSKLEDTAPAGNTQNGIELTYNAPLDKVWNAAEETAMLLDQLSTKTMAGVPVHYRAITVNDPSTGVIKCGNIVNPGDMGHLNGIGIAEDKNTYADEFTIKVESVTPQQTKVAVKRRVVEGVPVKDQWGASFRDELQEKISKSKAVKNKIDEKVSAQLQPILKEQRQLHGIPGVSAALITSENKIWIGTDGYSSRKDSIQPEMLFGLGSVTKTYFSTIVMQLVEKGKLSLDDSIKCWLPEMPFIDSRITIRQLLNHTSGLYRYQGTPKWFGEVSMINKDKIWTPKEILDSLVKKPKCSPGVCWGESATDYVILGMIIEKVTGNKAVNVLKNNITLPLGLTRTILYPDEIDQSNQLAHFWWDIDHSGKLVDVFPESSKVPLAAMFSSVWTSGAIISTAEDLAIFSKALFENGILSEASLKQMITPIQIGDSPKYGFSVVVDTIDKKTVYWHTGGIGYSSVFIYVPDDKLTIAVVCNLMVDLKPIAFKLYYAYKGVK